MTVQPTYLSDVPPTERPLLEVVTRHIPSPRRHELLLRQQASLITLPCSWVQTLLVDPGRHGVPASHVRLRTYEPWAHFVWILDDDDACRDPGFAALLDPESGVDLYMFRVLYDELDDFLPLDPLWAARTVGPGMVSPSNLVVSRDLWMTVREAWGERYAGDYNYVAAALQLSQHACWADVTAAHILTPSHGAA